MNEGRILPDGTGGFKYEYFLRVEVKRKSRQFFVGNHLGNTRVCFIEHGDTASIQGEDHYYPFGMTFDGMSVSVGTVNKYLYNGKELQDDMGLDWYDYGARFYDAALGRWHVVDPLAETYYNSSPYNYVANNPTLNIDPNGMDYKSTLDSIYGEGNYWYRGKAPGTWGGESMNFLDNYIKQSDPLYDQNVDGESNNEEGKKKNLRESKDSFSDVLEVLKNIMSGERPLKGIMNEEIFVKQGPDGTKWFGGNTMEFETRSNGCYTKILISFVGQPNMSMRDRPLEKMSNGNYRIFLRVIGPTHQLSEGNPNTTINSALISIELITSNKQMIHNIVNYINGNSESWKE